jgi:hypothetical protein
MSQINSQVQFSDSETHQPSRISISYNPQGDATLSHKSLTASNEDAYNVIAAQSQIQLPQQAVQAPVISPSTNLQIPVHPTFFFFRPPNDFYHYHVNCKEITDNIEHLLKKLFNDKENITQFKEDEYTFFYQQKCNNRFYQVTCEIVSPLLVNNCLNKNFLGFELQQQNIEQERLAFNSFYQKENLEGHLKQYLSQYLLN